MYMKIVIGSAVLFVMLILSLAIPPRHTKKILGRLAVLVAVLALLIYGNGYGYLHTEVSQEKYPVSICVLRTVFDSCRIFVGANNWDAIRPAYDGKPVWEILFWIIQVMALSLSASAIVVSLGSRLLKEIRMWVLRVHDIALIFGLNENTLEFGRELADQENTAILYVDQGQQTKLHTAVEQMGALIRCDANALSGNVYFLKSIGLRPGNRRLHVFALDSSMVANRQFSRNLLQALEQRGISPDQTTLTILSPDEETDNPMQALPERYGYGSLLSLNEPEMVARMLVRSYPPYKSLTFDEIGRAQKDFHGVLIGFGQIGQAVLRQLVMNSQFCGSTSRIAVFAPDYEKRIGWISHECREMLNHYCIDLYPYDGRSRQIYDYLEQHAGSINYVAVCAGSEMINLDISEKLQLFLQRRGCSAPILMCTGRGVSHLSAGEHIVSHKVYVPEILCSDRIDRMAMVLNQSYQKTGDMRKNWKRCNYFDRMSSRAAADFYDALLYSAGVTREEAENHWNPQGDLLENLAASEHLRWNAFHYCMGFRPMTEEEFRERSAAFEAATEKDPNTKYRVTKDVEKRIHACMIPWEELDAYSAKENAVTKQRADYAENDRNNVRDLTKVLRAMKKET